MFVGFHVRILTIFLSFCLCTSSKLPRVEVQPPSPPDSYSQLGEEVADAGEDGEDFCGDAEDEGDDSLEVNKTPEPLNAETRPPLTE